MKKIVWLPFLLCAGCSSEPQGDRTTEFSRPPFMATSVAMAPSWTPARADRSASEAILPPSGNYEFRAGDGQSVPLRIDGGRLAVRKEGRTMEGRLKIVGDQLCLSAGDGRPDCMRRSADGDWSDDRVRRGGIRLLPR
ncbi:hypothetical protein WJT74_06940 [Sphingomicrobium sp. XHP0239]|uniref:hypothetical protein n=1 Tax=Sphingomicrobium maritimum TaxID=3133972 RepID=UPI0031CC5786